MSGDKYFEYVDNSNYPNVIVFQCWASDILKADLLYKQKIGADPIKQPYIGCRIKKKDKKL